MGEVGRATDEEDGVAVDQTGDGGDVGAVGRRGAGDQVQLDFEVGGGFLEGCVGGFGDDPACCQRCAYIVSNYSRWVC